MNSAAPRRRDAPRARSCGFGLSLSNGARERLLKISQYIGHLPLYSFRLAIYLGACWKRCTSPTTWKPASDCAGVGRGPLAVGTGVSRVAGNVREHPRFATEAGAGTGRVAVDHQAFDEPVVRPPAANGGKREKGRSTWTSATWTRPWWICRSCPQWTKKRSSGSTWCASPSPQATAERAVAGASGASYRAGGADLASGREGRRLRVDWRGCC